MKLIIKMRTALIVIFSILILLYWYYLIPRMRISQYYGSVAENKILREIGLDAKFTIDNKKYPSLHDVQLYTASFFNEGWRVYRFIVGQNDIKAMVNDIGAVKEGNVRVDDKTGTVFIEQPGDHPEYWASVAVKIWDSDDFVGYQDTTGEIHSYPKNGGWGRLIEMKYGPPEDRYGPEWMTPEKLEGSIAYFKPGAKICYTLLYKEATGEGFLLIGVM